MNYLKNTRFFINLFNMLGLSSCKARSKITDINRVVVVRATEIFSKFAWGGFCLSIALYCMYVENFSGKPVSKSTVEIIIFNLTLSCDSMRAVCILIQCVCYRTKFTEIHNMLQKIESYFFIHLNHRILYQPFRYKFTVKCVVLLSVYAQYMIGIVTLALRSYVIGIGLHIKLLQIVTVFTFLHIILYVDALSFHLGQLNVVLKRDVQSQIGRVIGDPSRQFHILGKLKSLKMAHFHLWLVTQQINRVFGWSLLTMFIYASVDVVFCVTWCYEELRRERDILTYLSMAKRQSFLGY